MRALLGSRFECPQGEATEHLAESELATRAQFDPGEFAPLYRHYLDPIHQYCYRRLGSREAAEDATSLVFERVLRALPGYRGGNFRAWIFAIAHNVITDHYRSARALEPLENAAELVDSALQPEALAIIADEKRLLLAALSVLPRDQRRVVELRLSGLPATEVAVILGRTPESVRTLQRRAIVRLHGMLGVAPIVQEARDA